MKVIQMKLSCRKAWDQRLIKHELKKCLLSVIVVVVVVVVVVLVVVVVVGVVVVVSFVIVFGRVATSGATAPRKEHFKHVLNMFNINFSIS